MASKVEKHAKGLTKVKTLTNDGKMLLSSHDWAKLSKEEKEAAEEVVDIEEMQAAWPRHVVFPYRWKK